jgi:hypothetical protein
MLKNAFGGIAAFLRFKLQSWNSADQSRLYQFNSC